MSPLRRVLLALFVATASLASLAADNDYDQAADLARLSQHENERMHYILLKSRVQDLSEQWLPFSAELDSFGDDRYQALKPLILEASIADLQAAVAAGDLDYVTITTFYLYRIREIESDSSRFLNGVIALNPNAINRARELDAARRQALEMGRDPGDERHPVREPD